MVIKSTVSLEIKFLVIEMEGKSCSKDSVNKSNEKFFASGFSF